jgi:hypothetical protein
VVQFASDDSAECAGESGQGDQVNFGFLILDFRLGAKDMTKTSQTAFLWFRSDNRKSAIQNPKWVGIFAIALTFVFGGAVVQAQPPKKVPRVGYLSVSDAAGESSRSEAIRLALRELGYIEGQNIAIEYRYAEGKLDRVPELAAELVHL